MLYENNNTNDTAQWGFSGARLKAQTFTVGSAGHTVSSVKLLLWWGGSGDPGILTVGITATNVGGYPTGPNLTSGTADPSTFGSTPGTWKTIAITPYTLLPNTKYAIVCSSTSSDLVYWRYSGDQYAEGEGETYDAGWTIDDPAVDYMFEVWGDPVSRAYLYFRSS